MAKQKKSSYRISFQIDGAQRDLFVHTTDERDQVKLHIKRLVSSKRTGAPCLESEEWAQMWLEQDAKDPRKQGLLSDGDNSTTYFTTYPDYFEQIIDLFDKLEADQKAALLEVLKERAAAV